jgi:segregation and condensation protein B
LNFLKNHIEALIFCAQEPIAFEEIQSCLKEMFDNDIPNEHITEAVAEISKKYESDEYTFQVYNIGGGYCFLTKPAYQSSISILLKQKSKKKLSVSSLETLSIIAYKQPITKTQIEQIRGVNCDYPVHKLLEKELIEIKGKSEGVGKPLLYGTSDKFMDYFGINNLSELPTPKDFEQMANTIGEATE